MTDSSRTNLVQSRNEEIVLARGVQGKDRSFYYAIMAADRESLLTYVDQMIVAAGGDPASFGVTQGQVDESPGAPYLTVTCPDQTPGGDYPRTAYTTRDDVPGTNVPCACGNPRHWAIWYTTEDAPSAEHKGG